MRNLLYKFKHFPLILILQSPIIIGFVLPILFYNDFYYRELVIDKSHVVLAKNYYLLSIFIINIICLYLLYLNPFIKQKNKIVKIEFLTIILVSLISILSTFISKLFFFNLYYLNLLSYISQHLILILVLLNTTINYRKKELIIIYSSLFLCNLICLYSGDSKFFLVTLIILIIIVLYKFSFKKFLYVILLSSLLAIAILGLKKIYRDYVHYGGMDKLNYQYNEKNVTYAETYDYRKTKDFFMKQKLEFLVFNKSYLYSNICGKGHQYKLKYGTDIEELISKFVFKDGKIIKENLDLKILNNYPELQKFIELKTQTHCYIFFRFVHRIDFFSPFTQVVSEVNISNYVQGKTYKPILYTFIPRFIFKNKPIDNADEVYMKLMDNLRDSKDKNRTIISVSILTEAWINFLNNGIFIISFIVSIFYASIVGLIFSNSILSKFLGASLIIHVLNFNLSLKQIISGSYQLFVIFVLFYFFCKILNFYLSRAIKKNIG
jgi:hypothetical protein